MGRQGPHDRGAVSSLVPADPRPGPDCRPAWRRALWPRTVHGMRTRDEAIVWAMTATALGGYSIGAGMIAWPCAIVVLCVNAIAHRRRRDP